MSGENAPRRRSWVLKLAFSVAFGLVLLEVFVRVAGLRPPVLYEPDEHTGFRLQPNQHGRFLLNRIPVNGWGVRDERPLGMKTPGVPRVLVLGDSVTWGGILGRQDALFTSALERELGSCEVVNAGVNGYSVAQMAAAYKTRLKDLEPDLVIVHVVPVDFLRPPAVQLTGNSVAFPLKRPFLATPSVLKLVPLAAYKMLGWECLAPTPAAVPREELSEQACLERNLAALRRLRELTEGGLTHLLLTVSPWMPSPENPPLDPRVAGTLEADGIEWQDLNDMLEPEEDWYTDHIHLSEAGHAHVAEALAQVVRTRELLPR